MEYQFSFTKKRLILLGVTMLFAALLIFAGGVVTGIGIWTQRAVKPVAGMPAKGAPAAQLASVKNALKAPAVPGQAAVVKAGATMPSTTSATAAPGAPNNPPLLPAAMEPAATVPMVAAATAALDPAEQPFVLQLGAFREQKLAKQLQTSLKEKGYLTTIFNMVDEDQRTWHMVRFGGYKDSSAASKAASEFTGKEGIQALVRRSDSL